MPGHLKSWLATPSTTASCLPLRHPAGPPRKHAGQDQTPLLPEDAFQLYAVATREPLKLLRQLPAGAVQPTGLAGVRDLQWGLRRIRLIVLDVVADTPQNALWEIFSTNLERVRRGIRHYRIGRSAAAQDLLYRLVRRRLGLPEMTYTVEDFHRETLEELIADLTPQERQAIIDEMPLEERRAILNEMPREERRAILQQMPVEERLLSLDPDEIDKLQLDPEARRAMLPNILRKLK